MIRFVRSYARQHRFWTIQFVVSSFALAALLPIAWFLYRTPSADLRIDVGATGNVVRSITLRIRRAQTKRDRVEVILDTVSDAINADTRLRVTVPAHLEYALPPPHEWKVTVTHAGDKTVYEIQPLPDSHPAEARLALDGRLFPRSAAVDMRIGIFAYRDNNEVSTMPVKLLISGLEGMTIDHVFPEPTRQAVRDIVYEQAPWRDQTTRDGYVALRGTDRRRAASDQFYLFVVATLFGTFVSVVISLLQVMINDYEEGMRTA